jgi:Endonuclease NucS
MPSEARFWKISQRQKLEELHQLPLDLEGRLEQWLAQDISVLDPQLLVIGRQVETAFGGFIDLLCLDAVGDLVVVELKRDKTPREITAQVLDYGSWVAGLSNEQITAMAESYLGRDALEDAFERRFGDELPEALGENHRLLVVGSEIDASSERIIDYLSGSHGVNINGAKFQYFRDETGQEFLARVFLVEPSRVEFQSRTRGSSKRRRNLTYEELEELAAENGVADLYRRAVRGLQPYFQTGTTRSSLRFAANFDGSRRIVFSLIPGESSATEGLRFQVYVLLLQQALDLSEAETLAILPPSREPYARGLDARPDRTGFRGFFKTETEVDRFLAAFARSRTGEAHSTSAG